VPAGAAAIKGHTAALAALLAAGADPNGVGSKVLLSTAAFLGHTECVPFLLAAGADPGWVQGDTWTPLHAAAYSGHTAVVRLLLQTHPAGALLDLHPWGTPLHEALRADHVDEHEQRACLGRPAAC